MCSHMTDMNESFQDSDGNIFYFSFKPKQIQTPNEPRGLVFGSWGSAVCHYDSGEITVRCLTLVYWAASLSTAKGTQ